MKRSLSLYFVLFFVVTPIVTEAQLLNKIRRAAEQGVSNAVERRVEREVENATQRQLEKAFGEMYGTDADVGGAGVDFSKIMKGINMNVPTEDSYSFTGMAEMEMTGTDEKGKALDPVIMRTFLNENSEYSGMEFSSADQQTDGLEKTIMIFDMKNNASIILVENEGQKSRMSFGLDYQAIGETAMENDTLIHSEDFEFKKTGKTKTIAGHLCEEYYAETEEYTGSYWVTQQPVAGIGSFWGKNSPFLTKKMKSSNKNYFDKLPPGDILEINSKSKSDKSTMNMTMTNIDNSVSNSFVMADYPNMMAGQTADK